MAMTVEAAADVLERMYGCAQYGEGGPYLILYGFEYADDLARLQIARVIREARLYATADVQIRHGMKLTRYLEAKPGVNLKALADGVLVERNRHAPGGNAAMTVSEAGGALREMYANAPRGEKGPYLILYGFEHADDLARLPISRVIRESGIHRSAGVQIRYGMKLTKYLQKKPEGTSFGFAKTTPIGFIGAGAVGGSLSVALSRAGYPVVAAASRTPASARAFAERLPDCAVHPDMQGVADSADFVFITAPDDAIASICQSIRWRGGRGVAHCSGAASLEPLDSAARRGAVVGAFHPLQAFTSVEEGAENIPGTTFGIEAPPELREYLETMARDIGGNPIFLKPEDKVLYHVSGVLMGNLLAVLASVAASMWPKFGHDRGEGVRALTPMMVAAARNLDANGVPQGVAGPYPRGDVGTIRKHLQALKADAPEYLPLYCELALAGLPFAVEKGALAQELSDEIETLVKNFRQ